MNVIILWRRDVPLSKVLSEHVDRFQIPILKSRNIRMMSALWQSSIRFSMETYLYDSTSRL